MTLSARIADRARKLGRRFFANDNIADLLLPGELEQIEAEVEGHVRALLGALVVDVENDHNSHDTPKRVAKMFVREVFAGRFTPKPKVTEFPNDKQVDELYVVGPIAVRSACSHHLTPIMGQAWVGVLPGDTLIGLSKFNRVSEWVMSRPQIQEEAIAQLADELEVDMKPRGLAVVVKARHFCGCWRGVRDDTQMTTSIMRGLFRTEPSAREEFLALLRGHEFECR